MYRKIGLLVGILIVGLGFCAANAKMPAYDALTGLLVDIKGWEATAAEGSQMNHPMTGEMVSATRDYSKDGATFTANLIGGGPAQMAMMPFAMNFSLDSSDEMVKNEDIDGFKVHRQHYKSDKEGSVVVAISDTAPAAVFVLNYEGLSAEDALEMVKKFPWKKMQKIFSN